MSSVSPAAVRQKRRRSVDDQGDADTPFEHPLLKKWRKKARTVARLDIVRRRHLHKFKLMKHVMQLITHNFFGILTASANFVHDF